MRWLTGLVVVACLAWGGWWFAGSTAMRNAAETWFADAAARGMTAEKSSLVVRGFPSRFDLTVENPRIGDPAAGVLWEAPFFQAFMLSYKPWHVIAALPNDQVLTLPQGRFDIGSQRLMGSLVVVPGTDLALDRIGIDGTMLDIRAEGGDGLTLSKLLLNTDRDPGLTDAHRIRLQAEGIGLPTELRPAMAGMDQVALVRLDATALLTAPIDRHVAETRPRIERLTLREGLVNWGDLSVFLSGDLTADAEGYAAGTLTLRVRGWRILPELLVDLGVLPADQAPRLGLMLAALSGAGGADSDAIEVPLTLANGMVTFALIPLAPAPRLR